tara:strand:- start:323 stop:499 length:177 start_codon:yes stop_codon:yes gene_type:complete
MIVLTTIIICLAIVSIMDYRTIKSLKEMASNNEKYIATLEKRNREDRIYKNEQFNKQQ